MLLKNSKSRGLWLELLIYAIAVVLSAVWFVWTDTHVNEQALHTLYMPFVRTLRILESMSFAGLQFIKEVHHGDYPYGIYALPLFFYTVGLAYWAIIWPFVACLFLLLLFSWTCFLAFPKASQSIQLFLLCFSFPLFQISIKSFSPHAWNVVLGFLLIILLEKSATSNGYLSAQAIANCGDCSIDKPLVNHWGFGILAFVCGLFCVAFKHFGALIVILYVICSGGAAFCHKQKPSYNQLLVLLLCLFCAIPFYPLENIFSYIEVMFLHNARFNLTDGFLLVVLFLGLILGLIWWFRRRTFANPCKLILAGRSAFILVQLLLFFCYIQLSSANALDGKAFYIFLTAFAISGFVSLFYLPLTSMGLYALFYASMGAAYFFFLFAYHIDFFLFPFLLLFYLAVREGLSRRFSGVLIVGGLLISNFFSVFQTNLSRAFPAIFHAGIEEKLFNSFSWRPLDWQIMPMSQLRREMSHILQPYLLENRLYGLGASINFKAMQEMNWPPYFFIDGALGNEEQAIREIRRLGSESAFQLWHQEGRLAILAEGLPSWNQYEPVDMQMNDAFIQQWEIEQGPAIKADFTAFIAVQFLLFMRKSGLLTDYQTYLIPEKYPLLLLHIRKDLVFNADYQGIEPTVARKSREKLSLTPKKGEE